MGGLCQEGDVLPGHLPRETISIVYSGETYYNWPGYAFVKFCDKDVEKQLRRQKHMIDGRECTLKIPDSQVPGPDAGLLSFHPRPRMENGETGKSTSVIMTRLWIRRR